MSGNPAAHLRLLLSRMLADREALVNFPVPERGTEDYDECVQILLERIAQENSHPDYSIAHLLHYFEDERIEPHLWDMLEKPGERPMRNIAAAALGQWGWIGFFDRFREMLFNAPEQDRHYKEALALALSQFGAAGGHEILQAGCLNILSQSASAWFLSQSYESVDQFIESMQFSNSTRELEILTRGLKNAKLIPRPEAQEELEDLLQSRSKEFSERARKYLQVVFDRTIED
jgi:hypothetical protein